MHSVLVIGCGSIGERHIRCFKNTGRAVVTVFDLNPTLLDSVASRYAIENVDDPIQALQDSRITSCVIATPAPWHIPLAVEAVTHGKHVLIEKPLALSYADIPPLIEAMAKRPKVQVRIGYVLHCNPAFAEARMAIREGRIGEMLAIQFVAGQDFSFYRPGYEKTYYRQHETGGGLIQDLLTHYSNLVEWFVGPAQSVSVDADHLYLPNVEVEDTVSATARNGKVLVSYAVTQFQAAPEFTFLLHGRKGSIRVEPLRERWGWMDRGETSWTWDRAPQPERDTIYIAQANTFLDAIEGKPDCLATLDEGIRATQFSQAALKSWKTGTRQYIEQLSNS